MPGFLAAGFVLAALVAAAGPLVIHLIERRRCRVVAWGAMELLAEALGKRRPRLLVRDRALLVLRTCALVAFGLAMARPYWSPGGAANHARQPLHAVLVIDNSASMVYEQFGGTLLDAAKAKAARLLRLLPAGSEVSIVPWCETGESRGLLPAVSRGEAERRLADLQIVNRSANIADAVDRAGRACRASRLPAKRVLLFTDQQAIDWPADSRALGGALPEVQVVSVAADRPSNAWVAELSLPDEVADAAGESLLTAVLRYQGAQPRHAVSATLTIDGRVAAEQAVELVSGKPRRLSFRHRFAASPGVRFAAVSLAISPDRLPADDRRSIVAPVMAQAPVLVVEAPGSNADETALLRRLIGQTDRRPADLALAAVERAAIDQLTAETLRARRLVVVAGVHGPGDAAALLRRYVEQGGQLLIATGGAFDPAAWNPADAISGCVLPLPLRPQLIGRVPSDGADIEPYWLSAGSIDARRWRLDHLPAGELDQALREAVFFRYAAIDAQQPPKGRDARTSGVRTLAALNNGAPLVVERKLGRGHVVFYTSGLAPEWNTLARSRSVLLLDRLVRHMLYRTLPAAELSPAMANVPAAESDLRPADEEQMRRCLADIPFRLLRPEADVRLAPADVVGEGAWRWFMAGLLALLLAEQAVVAVSTLRGRSAPA